MLAIYINTQAYLYKHCSGNTYVTRPAKIVYICTQNLTEIFNFNLP